MFVLVTEFARNENNARTRKREMLKRKRVRAKVRRESNSKVEEDETRESEESNREKGNLNLLFDVSFQGHLVSYIMLLITMTFQYLGYSN